MNITTLPPELLHKMDAYRLAAIYRSIGRKYSDPTFFMRADQVEAAWQMLMPMLGVWTGSNPPTFPNRAAGSTGPKTADELFARKGNAWRPIT